MFQISTYWGKTGCLLYSPLRHLERSGCYNSFTQNFTVIKLGNDST